MNYGNIIFKTSWKKFLLAIKDNREGMPLAYHSVDKFIFVGFGKHRKAFLLLLIQYKQEWF